ncbi:ATP-binding cassette subfamily B protein/ATP-binding cassette subfamily C protein/ATP-binding cassette subfamily B multidrug efflux pump [Chitinivorax tropicus]|uniref:ATP-binding cassette subfamily B protein/ATP-binding cassette subfamily C protein/ATP-binding cassette subfamily B multidrug efflux pump n=1 Tax=Chitinivorax tropicus TaxID=714531 RepID=A0A840MLW9_9PROT|nr:ABC transporter transmembrane domain-containing protein [Chitinivorax tropicus]MBB5017907.1 ATP-binding cassette subfamily B protein/ATP-binding cassette subfamily C protein/ATP-binding cassette subfamily B multidrug efflux pump [Chitinivorax tropicus]
MKRFDLQQSEQGRALALLTWAAEPEKRHLWWGVLWLLIATGLEMLGPILGKIFIDDHLLPRHFEGKLVVGLLLGTLLSGVVATILRYLQLIRLSGVAMRSVRRLRESVYSHVLALPMAFFDKAITGQLVSRVTNDTEAVKSLYVQVLFVMLDSCILLVGALVAMAWLDWRLMLIVSVLIPAVMIIVWFYQRLSAPAVTRARQLRSDINAQMAESIAGMAVLQASQAQGRFEQRFAQTNESHYHARLIEIRANAWLLRPALDLLNVLLLVTVIFNFGLRDLHGVEIGVLYAFVSYISRVVEPLIQITMQFSQLQQSVVAAARVNTLLKETEAPPAQGDAVVSQGAVSIKQLRFGYLPGQTVLHDLSLEIPAGGFYGIVGHTGSGKSTLLSLMLRFYEPQQGEIDIDGVPIHHFNDLAFRAGVGLVPQEPFLLAATARENIDMGRGLTQMQIETAARSAQVHDLIMSLEQGYDTQLGEGGVRLSTGQKQLIAIARALAGQPRILLLDEATAHIDSETEQVVQQALTALHGKVTLIAIAHRLSTIRDADRIVVLNHGRVAELGDHDELMAIESGIYQRLYLLQQLEESEPDDGTTRGT